MRAPRERTFTTTTISAMFPILRLFVHDANQPLVVNDLKLGAREGGVALWIGAGSEGFFSDLRVSR